MSQNETDRALLFGIIALQNSFLSRSDMVASLRDWLCDKTKAFDAILLERNLLSEKQHALIAALLKQHLRNHNNDASLSLAEISSIGSLRNELNDLKNAEIDRTIQAFSSDSSRSIEETAGVSTPIDARETAGARYRIIRPHARGGLGQVSVARDEELNREVALKEIQTDFADNEINRARFLLEAEVTGSLEHPGIVPVYGLGRHEDGRPFYAMRFIRGDSLQQAVDRYHSGEIPSSDKPLELRKLLGRFVDVCNAIGYAHSRGVLHRDLKPGNIMLGKYGETLVVDWGLAKPVGRRDEFASPGEETFRPGSGSGSAPTQAGTTIGTPAYMSPEQAAGNLDEVGTLSDVYCLGATLYYLLTGHRPFHGKDASEIIAKVKSGDFRPPTRLNSDIPKSLEAICLRAMATQPNQRYTSPLTLADDVERFLADEPVSAYKEPPTESLRRWVRKHPTLVAAIAATVLVGLFSAILIAFIVAVNNRALAVSNGKLQKTSEELAKTNESLQESIIAQQQATAQAETARDRAEASNRQTREVLKYVSDVAVVKLVGIDEARPVRQEILDKVIEYHRSIASDTNSSDATREQISQSLFEVGYLSANVGHMLEAADAYRQAAELREQALRENTDNDQLRHDLAMTYTNLANAELQLGHLPQAEADIASASRHFRVLADKDPEDFRYASGMASAFMQRGLMEPDIAKSLALFQQGAQAFEKLLQTDRNNPRLLGGLSTIQMNMANRLIDLGRLDDAADMAKQSQQNNLLRGRVGNEHNQEEARRFDPQINTLLALIEGRRGNDEAIAHHQKAIEAFAAIAKDEPTDVQLAHSLSMALNNRGMFFGRIGQMENARQDFLQCIKIREQLVSREPNNLSFQSGLGNTLRNLAAAELALGDTEQAREHCTAAIDMHNDVIKHRPDVPEFQERLKDARELMTVIDEKE